MTTGSGISPGAPPPSVGTGTRLTVAPIASGSAVILPATDARTPPPPGSPPKAPPAGSWLAALASFTSSPTLLAPMNRTAPQRARAARMERRVSTPRGTTGFCMKVVAAWRGCGGPSAVKVSWWARGDPKKGRRPAATTRETPFSPGLRARTAGENRNASLPTESDARSRASRGTFPSFATATEKSPRLPAVNASGSAAMVAASIGAMCSRTSRAADSSGCTTDATFTPMTREPAGKLWGSVKVSSITPLDSGKRDSSGGSLVKGWSPRPRRVARKPSITGREL